MKKIIAAGVLAFTVAVQHADAQPQTGARVPKSVLERYVGEWVYPDRNSFMVAVRGDTLFQDMPGRRFAYAAISDTLFMLGPVFTAEFVIDKAGGATQILSDGVGIEYRLRRKGSPVASAAATRATAIAAVRVPRSVLERYVGVYEFTPGQMSRTDLRIVIRLATPTCGCANPELTPRGSAKRWSAKCSARVAASTECAILNVADTLAPTCADRQTLTPHCRRLGGYFRGTHPSSN